MFDALMDDAAASGPGRLPDAVDDAGWTLAPAGEPSGWLALDLDSSTAEPATLSDDALIDAVVGFDRVASWAMARQARLLAELTHRRPADAVPNEDSASAGSRFVADEVGVALALARGTAAGRVGTACRLLSVLPDTHTLWESGLIDTLKARAIDEATTVLPDGLAQAVEARVLPRAPEQSLPQLRAALARAILAVDPAGAGERHREARRDRRVCVQPEPEGMGSLWALLTADDAAGAYAWLTRLARGLGRADPRNMDTRRADLLADMLNGRLIPDVGSAAPPEAMPGSAASDVTVPGSAVPGSAVPGSAVPGSAVPGSGVPRVRPVGPGRPLVQVVMAHSTLTGADDAPAELVGSGPISADHAREIAADAVWRRLVTDPLSGTLLDHGRTTYHPPAGLADHVRARDQYCRFPLCRRRAADAELDHAVPWADGGETSATNLHALCGHHHRLKTHSGWRIEAHPDGRLTWVTPTGRRHTTAPHRYGPEPPPARSSIRSTSPGPSGAGDADAVDLHPSDGRSP